MPADALATLGVNENLGHAHTDWINTLISMA